MGLRWYPVREVRRDPERIEVRLLARRVPLAGQRVLDIGCGDGRLTRRLAGLASALVGIDPDREAIDSARALTPARLRRRVRFEVADGRRLPFPEHAFPALILSWSL